MTESPFICVLQSNHELGLFHILFTFLAQDEIMTHFVSDAGIQFLKYLRSNQFKLLF